MNKQTRILTIDGGGIRGLIPARILVSLERKLQQRTGRDDARLAEFFDLVAGTSTGGLITCLLLMPGAVEWEPAFSAQEIVDLYLDYGPKIFNAPLLKRITSLGGIRDERYDASGLENLIDERFGSLWLSQLIKPCLITAYDVATRKTVFFTQHDARSTNKDFPIKVVARATSAAPTYFEAMPNGNGHITNAYVDGGLFANNPTMCAYVEAYRKLEGKPTAANMVVLSLGTGQIKRPYSYQTVRNWGMLEWAQPLIDIMMAGVSETIDHQMQQLFAAHGRRDSYLRLQPTIEDEDKELAELDNVSPDNMERLLNLGIRLADEYEAQLDAIVEQLLPVAEPVPA